MKHILLRRRTSLARSVRFRAFILATVVLLLAIFTLVQNGGRIAKADGRTQHLNSSDEVPDGLTQEDWQSIRAAYEANSSIAAIAQQAYLKPGAVGTTQGNDRFGYSVAVSGDTVVVAAPLEDSSTTGVNSTPNEGSVNSGAAYVFTRSAGVWTQQAYLKPAAVGTTQANDFFGASVAVSGDTLVVGAYQEDSSTTGVNSTANESSSSSGAAYVFTRSAGVWTQQAYLKPAAVGTTQAGDWFGWSVAVSGDTLVVGATGEDSSTTGVNSTANESSSASGAAYVFTRTADVWTQQAYLKPAAVGTTQAGDEFGWSVAVSGDTVAVGAPLEDSSTTGVNSTANDDGTANSSGAAYVFTLSAGVWTQESYLKPAAVGTTQASDRFGESVAVSGDTVAVGAPLEDSSTTGVNSTPNELAGASGAAYVFTRSADVWTQQAYLKPAAVGTTQAGDNFGYSVAVSGDTVAVGAINEDSNTTGVNSAPEDTGGAVFNAGAAYMIVGLGRTVSSPYDFDGDGKDDHSVYRNGIWYLLRSTAGFAAVNWGLPTDKTVAGDYDGDGKADAAVFRDGAWIILNSSNGAVSIVNWGQTGDIPMVGDYDGDNKTDFTVFRGGNWYILQSSNGGFTATGWGLATDKPVVGKFDADNKSDIAVFRNGNWYILGSLSGFSAVGWGLPTDTPVPGDYDGDGRTDVAVFRGGNWYILGSTAGFSAVGWGLPTDTPVPADYDGDGKSDVAVFRNGDWYILQSSNGAFSAVGFGTTGDRPIPAQLQ